MDNQNLDEQKDSTQQRTSPHNSLRDNYEKARDNVAKAGVIFKEKTIDFLNDPRVQPVKDKINTAFKEGKQFCDDKGITQKAKDASTQIRITKETFTGEKALEEVNKMISLQNCYNDILATKLQEALDRIDVLEQKLNRLEILK